MKQKRDVILVVFSVILLFLVAGCKETGTGGTPTTPFIGGTQGLQIGVLEGSPPDEVTDGNSFPFNVVISLKNLGEYDLKKDKVKVDLIGFLPSLFNTDATTLNDLNPADDPTPKQRDAEGNIIEPVETLVTFPKPINEAKEFNYKSNIIGNTPFIFRADVCYRYQTKAVSEICALENMLVVAKDAICNPIGEKSVFSSGSPIQVNSFRQSVAGKDKVQFSFDIVHSGQGNIFKPTNFTGNVENCPKELMSRRTAEDNINVIVKTGLADSKLNCIGLTPSATEANGNVRLVDGKRTITCTQDLSQSPGEYKKSVDITLNFNYLDSAQKEILVKHLLGTDSGGGVPPVGGGEGNTPNVETLSATDPADIEGGNDAKKLQGRVKSEGKPANVWFVWGKSNTLSDGKATNIQYVGKPTDWIQFDAIVDGLESGPTYYYQARAEIIGGGTSQGALQSFQRTR